GGQRRVALEHGRERLAGHELHDEVGRAVLLAVVEDARDALVVHEGGVAGLGAEALEEARIPHVLVFEDLDRDSAADDVVGRLPHLAHAADGDTGTQLITPAERHTLRWPHCASTASMTFFAMGAAIVFPEPFCPMPPPSSTTTATATSGSSAGANPENHSVYGRSPPFAAVPVLPATSTPSILAPVAAPSATLDTIMSVMASASSASSARPRSEGV